MTDDDVLEKVLGTLPEDYNKIVLDLQKRIGKGLRIKTLKEDVKAAYELNCKQRGFDKSKHSSGGGETAFLQADLKVDAIIVGNNGIRVCIADN